MSLATFLLNEKEFQRYYNCSAYNVDIIPVEERRHVFQGITLLLLGVLLEIFYLPCLYAMCQRRLIRQACYRFMLYMGLCHIIGIANTSLNTGWLVIEGAVYCTRPLLIYFLCHLSLGLWVAESIAALILAVNRCMTIYDSVLADRFFGAWYWTIIWLAVPTSCGFAFVWNSTPVIFNSISASQFVNPHMHYLPDDSYTFIQVSITCILVSIAAISYLIQQKFSDFKPLHFTSTYGFICYQGSPAFIYLCLNQQIRMIVLGKYNKTGSKTFFSNHVQMTNSVF
ncbi:serpentine type 7TM GPCR chemoreceptor srt domain-containing protein [Ditylenchus destructor]|uniref:Serpentine type 7TM GPCR chemoreceptor srt domain-containing protein n=1 Tax=Ditylenchus destructor TaxID=166010 RepID=A0AAD4MY03_9BILA|nr:serpentine type 7TM GPCR chemoreceptor srt domain-containing protein [Ditylenchus destructor]